MPKRGTTKDTCSIASFAFGNFIERRIVQLSTRDKNDESAILTGTTLRVYRFLYKQGSPQNIHDVQRGLSLSSPSVAQYHLRKLFQAGLIKEQDGGYLVDRVVFENMIRIRRTVIPFQVGYIAFFATLLVFLFAYLGKSGNGATGTMFYFALFVTLSALVLFSYEVARSLRSHSI